MPYASATLAVALSVLVPIAAFLVVVALSRSSTNDPIAARRTIGLWLPRMMIVATLCAYVCVGVLGVKAWLLFNAASGPGTVNALSDALSGLDAMVIIGIALAVYLLLPGVVGALLSVLPAARWTDPACILVLRRFARDDSSHDLKARIRQEIAPFGHVYTLADTDINSPWYVRLPVLLTQLVFLHFRHGRIRDQRALTRLLHDLGIRFARNVNWLVSWSKVFPVYCSDEMWRRCVAALGERADVIIIDVSILSENLRWEIEDCVRGGLDDRLILLTDAAGEVDARRALDELALGRLEHRLVIANRASPDLIALLRETMARAGPRSGARTGGRRRPINALSMVSPIGGAALLVLAAIGYGEVTDYLSTAETTQRRIAELTDPREAEDALDYLIARTAQTGDDETWRWTAADALEPLWDMAPRLRPKIVDLLVAMEAPGADALWRRALRELPDAPVERKLRAIATWRNHVAFDDGELLAVFRERHAQRRVDAAADAPARRVDRALIAAIDSPFVLGEVAAIAVCSDDAVSRDIALSHIASVDGMGRQTVRALEQCVVSAMKNPATAERAIARLTRIASDGAIDGHAIDLRELPGLSLRGVLDELWTARPTLRAAIVDLSLLVGDWAYSDLWHRALFDLPELELERQRAVLRRWSETRHLASSSTLDALWERRPALRTDLADVALAEERGVGHAFWRRLLRDLPDEELERKSAAIERWRTEHPLSAEGLAELLRERSAHRRAHDETAEAAIRVDRRLIAAVGDPENTWMRRRRMAVLAEIANSDRDAGVRDAARDALLSLTR